MQRTSQAISDALVRTYIDSRNNISQSYQDRKSSYKQSFKYALLNDNQINLFASSASEFQVFEGEFDIPTASEAAISEARYTDFMLGALRVKTQYDDLIKAKASGVSSAWLLVTAYYCCFFACIEILKMHNKFLLSFDDEDISKLHDRLTGTFKSDFINNNKNMNFIGSLYAGRIKFSSSGTKPHKIAWIQLQKILQDFFENRQNWDETTTINTILSTPSLNPSRIRNTWNYKRPDYFGATGENINSQFKKLIGDDSSSNKWLIANSHLAIPDDGCRIASLCEILAHSVIDARRILA
jgi:hypothetical protein